MIETKRTILEHFMGVFGDKTYQYIDLFPMKESIDPDRHKRLSERFTDQPATEEDVAKAKTYGHCCWCNPELIYTDDLRGNEVWLHKHTQ